MNRIPEQSKSGNIIVLAIKSFIGKIRQNPDIYPIRYYKKNRRFNKNLNGQIVK
jgi:hypothetical protein